MLPYFQWHTIQLGPVTIQVWGLFVSLGMALSLIILARRAARLPMPIQPLLDCAFWMIVAGVVMARLFHVFLYEPAYYLSHPVDILKIWHGGLSSYGGITGGALILFWFIRKKKFLDVSSFSIADAISFSAVFGWMVGRIGCVMTHLHPGIICPDCFLSIRMQIGEARLDMALLEIIGLMPLAIAFFLLRKRVMRDGWFFSVLFVYYGALRFVLDFFRATDIPFADARYLGLTPAQYGAIVMVAAGGVAFFRMYREKISGVVNRLVL